MKTKRMNCETARSICIVKTLAKLGHFPSHKSEKEAWFLSPLRSETQASFKVSIELNRWYDFGIGKGGNVIDLVCLISGCSVGEALDYLSEGLPVSKSNLNFRKSSQIKEPKNKILKILPIGHCSLKEYLSSRKIPLHVAATYCKEIWYECHGKTLFALGLKNHSGGWELRNLYGKSSTTPKSYSYLKKGGEKLIVLEGMFDLLSLAVVASEEIERADLLILNSLSFISEVHPICKNYKAVTLYLDRDPSGRTATKNLLKSYSHIKDESSIYKNFQDLNEMLVRKQIVQILNV